VFGAGSGNHFVAWPLHSDALQSFLELAFGVYINRPIEHLLEGRARFAQNEIAAKSPSR